MTAARQGRRTKLRPSASTTDGGGLRPYASWYLLSVEMGACACVSAEAYLVRVFLLRPRRGEHSLRRDTRMEPAIEDVCPAISGEDGPRWMEPISHDEDAPQCRICFDGGCFGEQGPLFRPCRCSGSMAWVHRECLDQWRRSSANPRSFFRCDNCLFEYRFGRAFVAYDRCSATVAVPLA